MLQLPPPLPPHHSESFSSESRSSERDYSNMDTQVFLNVYDLTAVNSYSIWFGFGIFHLGIQGEKHSNSDLILF
ncbi:putative PPPDE peptidase domain-containing protein [Helianthus annuus]|nr:putative PPPDE peptidase domain-containing protein [Helianthus annuus]